MQSGFAIAVDSCCVVKLIIILILQLQMYGIKSHRNCRLDKSKCNSKHVDFPRDRPCVINSLHVTPMTMIPWDSAPLCHTRHASDSAASRLNLGKLLHVLLPYLFSPNRLRLSFSRLVELVRSPCSCTCLLSIPHMHV